jgi:hypothetical protein
MPRQLPAFRYRKKKSRERRTVCWRENGFEPPVPRQIGNGFGASSKSSRSTIGATGLIRAVAGPASNRSSCRATVRGAPLTGRTRLLSPPAALSALRAHRFGIDVSKVPSFSREAVFLKCDQTSAQRLVQIHVQVVGILNLDQDANKRRCDTRRNRNAAYLAWNRKFDSSGESANSIGS